MRVLVALLIALTAVAGCFATDPAEGSEPTNPTGQGAGLEAAPAQEVWIASSVDGKRIHNTVFLPNGTGPFPAFINFSPYWGDTAMDGGDNFAAYLREHLIPAGYAVVLSAVRGTGHSEGCFQIAGDLEIQDTYDVIDFFANTPWSNGAVAAGGKSYDSTTQNGLIAKNPHPALKGIFHVSGITDMYRYNYVNGVPYVNGLAFTPRYYATQGLDEYAGATNGAGSANNENPESILRVMDDAACTELPEHVASGTGSAASGQKDAYWIERDWNRYIATSEWAGSIFFVHGLQDWNVKPDHILPWLDLLPQAVADKTLVWLHQDTYNLGHVYPMRDDWNATMMQWLDATLRGADNGIFEGPLWQIEATDGQWRASSTWPMASSTTFESANKGDIPSPTQTPGTAVAAIPMPTATRISGAPEITLQALSSTPDPILTAILYDVAPDGTQTWIGEAVLRGMYRDGLETPNPVDVTQPTTFTLTAYPLDVVIPAGHSLHVVAGGRPEQGAVVTDTQLFAVEYGSPTTVSYVATNPETGLMAPQPNATDCFAC